MTAGDPANDARTAPGRAPAPPRSPSADRYVLLEELGAGGMGVVWAAYDRQLDRKVALKLLHDRFLGAANQERLAREARAMARLAHPNVVAVFDAGEREGRAFVAMEFVRGQSLADWLRPRRAWRDVVEVFRAVAEGLAAAHAAGIVHRDVKPGNILVGDDGRARIADFGVARADGGADGPAPAAASVVETTGFAGSPAYMAPEQLRAERADARADQFGLCVALHEALAGERPFRADTVEAQLEAIDRGPPALAGVPAWLAAIVARGLAADPAGRFRSMAELAGALAGPAPARARRAVWLVAAGLAIAIPATLVFARRAEDAPAIACDVEARAAFGDTWTPARRAALVAAFAATGEPGGAAAGEAIAATADRLAEAWTRRWESTCRAARVEHTWPEELGVRATACLGDQRTKLRTLLDALARPDEVAVANGGEVMRRLEPVARCSDPEFLRGRVIPPRDPAHAAEIAMLETRAEALSTAFSLRRHTDAKRDFPAFRADVERVGDPRLLTRALGFETVLAQQRNDLPAAIAASTRAYLLARRHRDTEAAAEAAADLTWLHGYEKGDAAAGDLWAELALVEIESIPHARVAFRVHSSIGVIAEHRGQGARAVEAQRTAYALIRRYYGDEHSSTALSQQNLAAALAKADKHDEAVPLYRDSLPIMARELGERSLSYALALNFFATMLGDAGDVAGARDAASRSIELGRAIDAQGADLGSLLNNHGAVLRLAGDLEGAAAALTEAHAAYTAAGALGLAGSTLGTLGGVRSDLAVQRDDAALERQAIGELEAAAREIEREWGATHPDRGRVLQNLARLHVDRGRCDQAAPFAARARAIFEEEPDAELASEPLISLGRCLIATRKPRDAVPLLERARELRATGSDRPRSAEPEAWLGIALLHAGDAARARLLLRAARAVLAANPARFARLVERIDRELGEPADRPADHPADRSTR